MTRSTPNLRLSLAFSALLFLLPSLVSDSKNFAFLYYADFSKYLLAKLIIWFFVPFTFLALVEKFLGAKPWWYWGIIWYFTTGVALYFSNSLLLSVPIALALCWSWHFCRVVLRQLFFVPFLAGMAVCVLIKFQAFGMKDDFRIDSGLALSGKELAQAPFELRDLPLTQSVYVIVFDELSKNVLYQDNLISPRFPHFQFLLQNALAPPRASTNYDYTTWSILSLLSGRFPDPNGPVLDQFVAWNIFDLIPEEKLRVWGTGEPYCRALQLKNKKAPCVDELELLKQTKLPYILNLDLNRLLHIYLTNAPITVAIRLIGLLPESGESTQLADVGLWLQGYVSEALVDIGMDKHQRELDRLKNFLSQIGTVPQGFYYYHSYLPHFPYIMNKNLEMKKDYRYLAFHLAQRPSDIAKINERYLRNIEAADTVLGKMLDQITARDPEAIVIVTSDHGAARDFSKPLTRPTGALLSDVLEIPFFLKLPKDHPLGHHPLIPYQHIDFLPTILEVLGVQTPSDKLPGVSIFGKVQSKFFHESKGTLFHMAPD